MIAPSYPQGPHYVQTLEVLFEISSSFLVKIEFIPRRTHKDSGEVLLATRAFVLQGSYAARILIAVLHDHLDF